MMVPDRERRHWYPTSNRLNFPGSPRHPWRNPWVKRLNRLVALLIIIIAFHGSVQAVASTQNQEVMTNRTIIELVKTKTGDALIINLIQQPKTRFSTSPSAIVRLKKAGVSDAVIQAMMAKEEGKPGNVQYPTNSTGPPSAPEEALPATNGIPTEIGAYVREYNKCVEVPPEVVNWQTGGVFKGIATLGIVKGDINGRIRGPHSPNHAAMLVGFLIIAPEGVAITEYQLLKLRQKKKAREFGALTGGVFHQSGGATRDLVPLKGRKIAPRTFTVIFSTLTPGEHGFLPPGAYTSASGSAQLGKMYTFRVTE